MIKILQQYSTLCKVHFLNIHLPGGTWPSVICIFTLILNIHVFLSTDRNTGGVSPMKRCCKLRRDIGTPVLFAVLFLEMEESSWTCF